MHRLKPFVAFLVLALWASCTIRCELLSVIGADEAACCISGEENSPAPPAPVDDCVCGWVKSGGYLAERPTAPLPPLVGLSIFALPCEWKPLQPAPAKPALSGAPPELRSSWQFSSRTARAPRAPSFVS